MPRCALRAEMCREKYTHLEFARTSEMSEIRPTCPKFAPRARDSRRRAEIRVLKSNTLLDSGISASVILDSGTFSDISDVLATAKFELCIFFLGTSRPARRISGHISARKAHLGAHLGVLDRAVSQGRV